ncbi:tripeptidyl-peptidase 2 [Helicoverpa zea]|uniref:tripeptidyl-peptidase 2 n=1 Tax=Helicoverpa zea TaxID=7113 RepID=UPI001F57EE92|nr:tripeptidyl-peptidase 2 [Helicoverpa zea]
MPAVIMKKLGRISYHILTKYQNFHSNKFGIRMTVNCVLPDFHTKSCHCQQRQCDQNIVKEKFVNNEEALVIGSSKMADAPIDCDFPVWGLMPKKETGVVSFINKHPEYDGRGTIIAILDSGVDPAATGLEVTSTGEKKVIERYDCSGCGDVDTSTIIKKVTDGCITGLTGRKLKIPDSWKNPSGVWRVGVLYPYSLYPVKLKERMQEHRKTHDWDVNYKPAFAEANKNLQDFETDVVAKNPVLSPEDKILKEELEARVEVLQTAEKKYNDVGPTYDCVLFHDGTVWRACIDTTESGELSSGVVLGEYSRTHEHTHLTPFDEMTVSINVHDDGNTLEVVGMCSTHGTHVAAIAAGYYPEAPELNGVAPGAKIVSLTIGDSRLGSMETGTALVRACIKIMELSKTMKIDAINMSYGEHAHWSNAGRVGEIICEVVNRYKVSWVVSGGNHGPALCTVGAPPDIVQPILIGVGAYVSPEMMSAAYSMRARLCGGAFSWSSRGPAADGAAGLSVCAPGGAVAAVARFTLRQSQLMNGTSMAAPHVAGAVAMLMSGLKAQDIPYSPYSIKRALENSATYLSHVEPWAQGCGLLNVEKAFDILCKYHDQPERDVTFSIQCGASNAKGILLRPQHDDAPKDIGVTVEPQFLHDHHDMENKTLIPKQIAFGVRLALSCDDAWLSAAKHLDMMNASRPITVRVDTTGLPPGPHFTSIKAYDVSCIEKGPVFRVPVTVLQPQPLRVQAPAPPCLHEKNVLFRPATIVRHFVIPPQEATWAVLKISTESKEKTGRFLIHTMQLLPKRSCRCHEMQKMINVTAETPTILPFQIVGGVTLEVVIAKYWANIGDVVVDYSVEFHGLKPDFGSRLAMGAADGVRAVRLRALRQQDVLPTATLKYQEPVLRPTESKLTPLTARDVIPPSRQIYQLINTYNFHIAKATEVSPIISLLSDMLYESEFESQMWMLYNSNKQLMMTGDAYPSKYTIKLEKGDYTLRLNIRHENKSLLEKLQDLPAIIQQRLQQPITLDVYCSPSLAITGGKKFTSGPLPSGHILPVYFTPVPADKISRSNLSIGQTLSGSVTFAKDELGRKVDTYGVSYVPCEPAKRSQPPRDKDKAKPHDDYMDAVKDFTTNWLAKLEGDKLEQVYEELVEKFPGYLGAHVAYLHALDSPTDAKKLPHANEDPDVTTAWCEQLITISEKVIKAIDQDKLLAYLGMKNDTRTDATKIKQEQEKQRGWAVEALCRRGAALCRLRALAHAGAARDKLSDALHSNLTDLLKFTDLTDSKALHYGVWHCFTFKQWGRAIKLLQKIQEERPSKEVEERLIEAYGQLGWNFFAKYSQLSLPTKYPSSYRPF